jgi:hypothetical protein
MIHFETDEDVISVFDDDSSSLSLSSSTIASSCPHSSDFESLEEDVVIELDQTMAIIKPDLPEEKLSTSVFLGDNLILSNDAENDIYDTFEQPRYI